jgi:hypothetical protein
MRESYDPKRKKAQSGNRLIGRASGIFAADYADGADGGRKIRIICSFKSVLSVLRWQPRINYVVTVR